MKKKQESLGILLACVTGAALLIALCVRTWLPRAILPRLDGPALVLLALIALVLQHYFVKANSRDYRLIPLYAFLTFGLFPFAGGFTAPLDALLLGLLGSALTTAVTFLFDSMLHRLSSGPAAKLAPLISALGLYLAAQCLMGIF